MPIRLPFVGREASLLLMWGYVLLLGGTVSGLIAYPLQALSAALLALAVTLWLGARLLRRRAVPGTGLGWAAALFIGAQALAVALAQDPRRGAPVLAQAVGYVLIFYCAFDLIRSGWPAEQIERTFLTLGAVVAVLAVGDVAQAFGGWRGVAAGLPYQPDFQYRTYAVYGDANVLAAVLNLVALTAAGRALAAPSRATRIGLGLVIALAVAGQVFTRSRGGQAGLGVGVLTLAVLWVAAVAPQAREQALKLWAWLRARPALLGAGVIVLVLAAGGVAWRVLSFRGSATQAPALSARSLFWGAAWQAFGASPVWGRGPGTYPSEYMRFQSVPPDRPYLHAHSVPMTILAEAGLLGLAAVALAAGAIVRALWRARRKGALAARARWAGAAAAWAGFAAHSLVDDHTRFLAVAVPLALMLAWALAEDREAQAESAPAVRRWPEMTRALALGAATLAAGAFTLYSLRAYALSDQAVDAGLAGDWGRAAALFDTAAQADPWLAFYPEQAGYAYGRLAAGGDAAALQAALERLERAARLEPGYALNHANLAALYAQAGQLTDARDAMQRAAELAPRAAFLQLNLGLYNETLGDSEAAQAAYQAALRLAPRQVRSGFWLQTPLRLAARDVWLEETGTVGAGALDTIGQQLAAGQAEEAEQALAQWWQGSRQSPLVYTGLAQAAQERGDLALAGRYLDAALWVQTAEIQDKIPPLLLRAEMLQLQGRTDEAIGAYAVVLAVVTEYGSLGWGTAGWTPHASFVWQRRALPLDVLPHIVRADLSLELAERLRPLADLYAARGDEAAAEHVRRALRAAGAP